MSLKKKMITGAFWSLLEKGGQQGLSLLVFLVLARILGPADYGLANICFIFFTLTTMVTAGLVDGIVSKQIDDDIRLSSLFWGVNAIGLGISVLCLILSVPLSMLMDEPRLIKILIWFSIAPLLVSLYSIPNTLLLKELDFKVYAIRSIFSTIIGGVVGVYMALNDYGPYAIVGQQIVIYLINNAIVWRSIKWRPKMIFSKLDFNQTIKPGVSVMGVNVLGFIDGQLPRLLVGTILGASALGDFALATRLRFALTEMLITSPLAVVYPSLAKIQNDKVKQKLIASSLIYLSGLIVFPIIAIAVASADQYVPLFFGEDWIPAVPVIQIFIGLSAVSPTLIIIQHLMRASNQMAVFFRAGSLFILANLLTGTLLFFDNGLILMSLTIVVITALSIPIYFYILRQQVGVDLFYDVKALLFPSIGSIVCSYSCTKILALDLFSGNAWASLTISIFASILVYAIFCILFQYKQIMLMYKMLKQNK